MVGGRSRWTVTIEVEARTSVESLVLFPALVELIEMPGTVAHNAGNAALVPTVHSVTHAFCFCHTSH